MASYEVELMETGNTKTFRDTEQLMASYEVELMETCNGVKRKVVPDSFLWLLMKSN